MNPNIRLPKLLKETCRESFLFRMSRLSRLQDDVISVLSSIVLHPEEEVLIDRGYRLDAVNIAALSLHNLRAFSVLNSVRTLCGHIYVTTSEFFVDKIFRS